MAMADIIARKRDGLALSREDIETFVAGVTDGTVPDYQASALLMAITLRGMNEEETIRLAGAMTDSGDRVDLSDIPGAKVGKHSTGGVGDKVSIVLAPLAAASGVIVPKMSGRGLEHTGGTLDKLESIPGYRVHLGLDEFKSVLRRAGASIISASSTLAPADKRLYALRNVTATVDSMPLIAASVMSKKLVEGTTALVLDVKCGDGAFIQEMADARALAARMVGIGHARGLRTEAVVTSMDEPLGRAVGNALEIAECVDVLKGRGPRDVAELAIRFAARMLLLAGVARQEDEARSRVERALSSGASLERFAKMIECHGGDPRVLDDPSRLAVAPDCAAIRADRAGFVTTLRARAIGRASHALGAGRSRLHDAIDHGVGVVARATRGDRVSAGEIVVELRHRRGRGLEAARALCREAIQIGDEAPAPVPLVRGVVDRAS
jgi:pyrimidine-nucleoside phosphorylase